MKITKERKLIYHTVESNEVIERNLDDFIMFMSSKDFQFRNDICAFFGIVNTTYFDEDSDYPHINSHRAEKDNLLEELTKRMLIIPKSSKTYRLVPHWISDDIQDKINTKCVLDTIYDIAKGKKIYFKELSDTCVISGTFINWHTNKFYPNATVDKLKELGWEKFYELNKDNIIKKREFFAKNS